MRKQRKSVKLLKRIGGGAIVFGSIWSTFFIENLLPGKWFLIDYAEWWAFPTAATLFCYCIGTILYGCMMIADSIDD